MGEMRIGILTSNQLRHRYFANSLSADFPVVAVGYEDTGYSPVSVPTDDLSPAERQIVHDHFAERELQERLFFGEASCEITGDKCADEFRIAPGMLNAESTINRLGRRDVDTVLVFGTNLIREPMISQWEGRMLNMHLGLSPYYRGTATNFYPLLNDEPQYVGATIHFIDSGIDSGAIVRHARPKIVSGDRPHTIGCKAILAGIEAMKQAIRDWMRDGSLRSYPQWKPRGARLYLRKDYHPRQVVELYRMLNEGLIERYVREEKIRDNIPRLIL